MKTYSLTRRLIWTIVLVELCSAVALVVSAGVYEGISHFRAFDVMLRGRADSMLGAVQDAEDPQDNVMLDGTQAYAPKRDIYAVRDDLGHMLGHSANWPDSLAAFGDASEFRSLGIGHRWYRVIRVEGLRMVDPGDRGGGIPRHVVILYGSPTQPVWRVIWRAVFFYALLSLLLLGVSVWIILRLLRVGLEPLNDLAVEASRVSAESWSFQPSGAVKQVRELAPLVSALELVLAGLERSFEQQKHFVSDAAHELKTSVAVVKSSLQVLTMKDRSPAEYRAGLERAEEDCQRMEDLVASMLMLAGLEADTLHPETTEPLDLADVVRDVLEQFRTTAQLARIKLLLHSEKAVWVAGEREKLRALISNVIHNALQHSAPDSEVSTILSVDQGRAELRVRDDGEGIPAEAVPFVFDRFYRGDTSRSRRTGGTGLGLAISRAIVDEMNGSIRLESEHHHGTSVFISLPIVPHPHPGVTP